MPLEGNAAQLGSAGLRAEKRHLCRFCVRPTCLSEPKSPKSAGALDLWSFERLPAKV